MDDAALVRLLKSGSKEAFAAFVTVHQKKVLNICYRFLLNREDSEDIAQEVFIEAYHSMRDFRGEASLGTWIYRIAVSKSLDEIKRQNRKKRISSLGRTLGLEHLAKNVTGTGRPDKALEEKEDYGQLMKALNRLPDNQRIALTLSKIEGYSNQEVADIMQTTLTAVDSLIYRAKQNLLVFTGFNRQK